jgi:starch synthase (maltosyl-transferring)
MINRFVIADIQPTVYFGDEFIASKAVENEVIPILATVIREGHEVVQPEAVLLDPKGKEAARVKMREIWPGTDRYQAWVKVTSIGRWKFRIEAFDKERMLSAKSQEFEINVERERALFSAWYEFFPRSEGAQRDEQGNVISGTFKTAIESLARVKKMGFDVLYLPPIHPIGTAFRKGKNNSLIATETDPGVPWAIGSEAGGHDAIHPELGSEKDFINFVKAAKKLDIEIALDFALQTSPDHPWAKTNREFFTIRPDGTIAYAENPPKKYQDIYPINFDNDYPAIRNEVLRVLKHWIKLGVKIFRVDNPHTKPVNFWQDLISQINKEHPDVIFLSEAFTRPAMMQALGKAGFQQGYTYFTWRVSKQELIEYGTEVSKHTAAFFRPNFWVNTPDILPFHLQSGNPNIFAIRATLAATLSPSWGMYAGYELYEHTPIKAGAEEYLDSEKYEIKIRDWQAAEKSNVSLMPYISKLNKIRNENLSLKQLRNLEFHHTDSDSILAYSKKTENNLILIVVNLDPDNVQETTVHWNLWHLQVEGNFEVQELVSGKKLTWSEHCFVKLDPNNQVAFIGRVNL